VKDDFQRITGYGYYTWEPLPELHLTGGVAYDQVTYPINFRRPPISEGSTTREQVSPKAAIVWSPCSEVTLRGAYTRSLAGVTFDESFRLEPTQLAGFSQSFRNLISESVVGSLTAPSYETIGAALDLKFKSRTYIGLQGQYLNAEVSRETGSFDFSGTVPPPPPIQPSATPQHLDYDEYSISATVNQLVSSSWSLGAQYVFTRSRLHTLFPEIPVALNPLADHVERADLQVATLFAIFNHPSGFFARAESQWYHQDNSGYAVPLPGDDFFMHNVYVGYRLRRQRGELTLGVLNLAGNDYKLNPLNPYSELPRERVFVARLKVNF